MAGARWFPIWLQVPCPPPVKRWGPCPLPSNLGRRVAGCDSGTAGRLPRRVGEDHAALQWGPEPPGQRKLKRPGPSEPGGSPGHAARPSGGRLTVQGFKSSQPRLQTRERRSRLRCGRPSLRASSPGHLSCPRSWARCRMSQSREESSSPCLSESPTHRICEQNQRAAFGVVR